MLLKIVVKDDINGDKKDYELKVLNCIHEEVFLIDLNTLTEEELELLAVQVEQNCNFHNSNVEFYESQDGVCWKYGIIQDLEL